MGSDNCAKGRDAGRPVANGDSTNSRTMSLDECPLIPGFERRGRRRPVAEAGQITGRGVLALVR